ncbi:unnamed protein product [marine sediment metagenome]|uniref:Uncharacterized protein n=1 Tax=marine sediment metagenome TaxID=412755 RepID=X1RVD2_9ZZZZ
MARLTALPAIEVIRGLKGIIDFYLWKGLPCARAWPRWRPARQSEASKAAALFFGAVVKSYSLLGDLPLAAYRHDAADQPRSARDLFVSGIFGNLHEADVSDFLGLLIECRDFLSALTAILGALDSIDTDEIVVNVDESVLPPLAATSTHQVTQNTALAKIATLQDALQSKHLDRLIVRGQDQFLSYKGQIMGIVTNLDALEGGNSLDAPPVPPGEVWIITSMEAHNEDNQVSAIYLGTKKDTTTYWAGAFGTTPAAAGQYWSGTLFLIQGDTARGHLADCTAGDNLYFHYFGHRMTLET